MPQDAPETRDVVVDLAREVADLRARVCALERAVNPAAPASASDQLAATVAAVPAPTPAVAPALASGRPAASNLSAAVGRTLVALGGAFFLRSLTDSGTLPPLFGIAGGLLYGAAWLALADRAARQGRRLAASLHLLVSLLIVGPLLAETTVRLKLLAPAAAAVLLALLGLAQTHVAVRHGFRWFAALAATLTAALLAVLPVASGDLLPFVLALLAANAWLETAPWGERGLSLRWPFALAADLALGIVFLLALRPAGMPEGYVPLARGTAALLGLTLAALHLASAAARSLRGHHLLGGFEVVQGTLALAIGWTGALRATDEIGAALVGLAGLGLAAANYFIAFAVVERHAGHDRNFYAYATFGAVLALAGSHVLLSGAAQTAALAAFACASAALGVRFDRSTLRAHAALFFAATAAASGLPRAVAAGLTGRPDEPLQLGVALALAAGALCAYALARDGAVDGVRRMPLAVTEALLAIAGTGLVARALASLAPGDPGLGAAAATAAIALCALLLAAAAGRSGRPELRGLAIAWLVAGGVKLLVQDLPRGRPLTLFVAFACFGGALIVLPRLLSDGGGQAETDGAS
ncbi:MAG: hypothetical protein NDJ94_02455 [Vicinamibacteria bacterium]|nr:hypothetical protein [Vicinamibacteria bacterium]